MPQVENCAACARVERHVYTWTVVSMS